MSFDPFEPFGACPRRAAARYSSLFRVWLRLFQRIFFRVPGDRELNDGPEELGRDVGRAEGRSHGLRDGPFGRGGGESISP